MRKLLVASQKGGVGKTTSAIHLAAAAALAGTRVLLVDADPVSNVAALLRLGDKPRRQRLRECGVDLPGVLVCDVLPGLDVLSPYDDGPCADDDLDDLFRITDAAPFRASYGCLVVNSAPFLGANPGQLIGACDGYVVVVRAESQAHRTLPAFLELVQRSRAGRPLEGRGILLTLPEGECPGGRWERELRGRLGSRALDLVVPYDAEVTRAFDEGRILVEVRPDAPAAEPYHRLAASLKLADDPLPLKKVPGPAPFAAAAASLLEPVGAAARGRRPAVVAPAPAAAADGPRPTAPRPAVSLPDVELPSLAALSRVPAPSLTLPAFRPPPAAVGKLETKPTGPEPEPARPTSPAPSSGSPAVWALVIVLAAAGGVCLRFVQLPEFMLPVAVGVAVSAAVVLLLRLLTGQGDAPAKPAASLSAALPRRPPGRDAAPRLAAPKRPSPSGLQRRVRRK